MEFLIEQNVSRVLYHNIGLGREENMATGTMTTLDEVLDQASSGGEAPAQASSLG